MVGAVRRAQLLLDALTAGVFGLITIPISLGSGTIVDAPWPAVLLVGLAMTAAVGCARRAPGTALAIASGTAILQMALGLPPAPVDLAVLGVLFASGADERRWLRVLGLVAAFLGATAIPVYLAVPEWIAGRIQSPTFMLLILLAGLVTFVLAWPFGVLTRLARRSRHERDEMLAAQLETAAEQERGRIARDMHDVVAHSLTVIVAQADGARYLAADGTRTADEALSTIATTAREALSDVRLLLERLHYRQGDLPQPGLGELAALVEQVREAGLEVEADQGEPPGHVPAATQLALYRIAQESLTNALRHGADAGPVRLDLAWEPGRVRLRVRSPLRFEPLRREPSGAQAGQGLPGMRERARLAGGELHADRDGAEFVVAAELPLTVVERAR